MAFTMKCDKLSPHHVKRTHTATIVLNTTSAIWQFSFRFSLVFTGFLVSRNLGNLEWEYILQIVKGQVRIDFTRLNLARPCRQVSWKTDMSFHVAMFQGFFRFFLVFFWLRNPWKPKCLITDVTDRMFFSPSTVC